MRGYAYLFGFSILFLLAIQSNVFASDDFQVRPPVYVPDNINGNRYEKGEFRKLFGNKETTQSQPDYHNIDKEIDEVILESPLIYFSLGIQTESTFFDRRLNWASYSTQLVLDTGNLGIRYQGSMSNAGREDFELFDSRLDIYGYWLPDFIEASEAGLVRVGGGLSYFDCEPLRGQEFLRDQHFAAFASIYYIFAELKFVMMIHDDVWNGGLIELKIFNPFLYVGFHQPDTAPNASWVFIIINAFLPYEFGITGSFDLPDDGDGWGWFVKGRYNFLFPVLQDDDGHLSMGFEVYWSYRDGFDNTKISGGWEFGMKFTIVGF